MGCFLPTKKSGQAARNYDLKTQATVYLPDTQWLFSLWHLEKGVSLWLLPTKRSGLFHSLSLSRFGGVQRTEKQVAMWNIP
jgi:hypothetical protein